MKERGNKKKEGLASLLDAPLSPGEFDTCRLAIM